MTFAIATVLGVIAGSFAWSILTKGFRWEGFASVEDTASHLIGAALMGFGGVVAMGCTVGQGITGFSTLALGSIVTFIAIVAAAAATLKFQYWRLMREALGHDGGAQAPSFSFSFSMTSGNAPEPIRATAETMKARPAIGSSSTGWMALPKPARLMAPGMAQRMPRVVRMTKEAG